MFIGNASKTQATIGLNINGQEYRALTYPTTLYLFFDYDKAEPLVRSKNERKLQVRTCKGEKRLISIAASKALKSLNNYDIIGIS